MYQLFISELLYKTCFMMLYIFFLAVHEKLEKILLILLIIM